MPTLATTMAIFKAMLDSNCMVPSNNEYFTKAGGYLAKWLLAVATLVDKSTYTVMALYDATLHGKGGRQKGLGNPLLFDIAYGLAHRVPLVKLVKLDGDVCSYVTALMVMH